MFFKLKTATLNGIEAIAVDVEVDVTGGLPGFHLVGLPMGAVREGGVRIKAALANSGFDVGSARVTVNLAPADVRKDGSAFDLPIAIAILGSRGQISMSRQDLLLAGELSLDGQIKPIRGALSFAESALHQGLSGIILPKQNATEASLVSGVKVYGTETLRQAVAFIEGQSDILPTEPQEADCNKTSTVDFSEVCGQPEARRAAEIAAAGGHNLMLVGPPGSGKTMIARRISSILPLLTRNEAIETTKIHSIAGLLNGTPLVQERPFRAPHHTCSSVGLVGGGSNPKPGEVSLAHHGVLFLDELPEFQRNSLEALRQPVEDRQVTIVRSREVITFPATFMLVAAMNPCRCGYRGSQLRTCTCGEKEAQRYLSRISGPLFDRFDIFVQVDQLQTQELMNSGNAEDSASIRDRVTRARVRQQQRLHRSSIYCNAQMNHRQLKRFVSLPLSAQKLLVDYTEAKQLTGRALHRICKVARTIADLEDNEAVNDEHLSLALTLQQSRWMQ